MNFKSFILSLCLVFATTFAFAGSGVVSQDSPSADQLEMVVDQLETLGTPLTIVFEDERSCTVTATVSIGGVIEAEVSATAETCQAAAEMILDLIP